MRSIATKKSKLKYARMRSIRTHILADLIPLSYTQANKTVYTNAKRTHCNAKNVSFFVTISKQKGQPKAAPTIVRIIFVSI